MESVKNIRELVFQQRRRAVMCCRLRSGFLVLFKQPWKLVFPALLAVIFLCAWNKCKDIPLPGNANNLPVMSALWEVVIPLVIVTFAVLLLFGLLVALGTPSKAKSIDAGLAHIALIDRYGIGPALISVQKIRDTGVRKLTFYSKGISMERWEKMSGSIADILKCHFIEPIQYGKNSNYIVLTVAPGLASKRNRPFYDEEV